MLVYAVIVLWSIVTTYKKAKELIEKEKNAKISEREATPIFVRDDEEEPVV
jgi:hypothetical protein